MPYSRCALGSTPALYRTVEKRLAIGPLCAMSKKLDKLGMSSYIDNMSNIQDITDPRPGLTFREKSLWVILLSTILVYGYYFWRSFTLGSAHAVQVAALFVEVVFLLVAIQIVGHILIALRTRPECADERDRSISLSSTRNAYFVFIWGVWFALAVAFRSFGTFWTVQAILLLPVLAEIVRCASQLVYYRRGV